MITNELLQKAASISKKAINAKRRRMYKDGGHMRNEVRLLSIDGEFEFTLKLRQSTYFTENFSVVLLWENANKFTDIHRPLLLMRFNGPHDGNKPLSSDAHHSFHIHKLTMQDIEDERYSMPERGEPTEKYSTFEEAIRYAIQECGIIEMESCVDDFWMKGELAGQFGLTDYLK